MVTRKKGLTRFQARQGDRSWGQPSTRKPMSQARSPPGPTWVQELWDPSSYKTSCRAPGADEFSKRKQRRDN